MIHNIQHICELPPLYEVERGLGGEYKKAKMKRCVQRVASKGEPAPLRRGETFLCSISFIPKLRVMAMGSGGKNQAKVQQSGKGAQAGEKVCQFIAAIVLNKLAAHE